MLGFLRRFLAASVTLAGVVGLYLAALTVDLVWTFWIVIGGAGLVATVPIVAKHGADYIQRIRSYPRLIKQHAELENQRDTLSGQLLIARERIRHAYQEGHREGKELITGALRAISSGIPKLVAIGQHRDSVCLIAQYSPEYPVTPKARFVVASSATGRSRGEVEVAELDEERQIVILQCVRPTSEQFWKHLAERVEYDESAPDDAELRLYTSDELDSSPLIDDLGKLLPVEEISEEEQ